MSLSFDDKLEAISKYPLFSKLTNEQLKELADLFKEQHFDSNDVIVNEGDPVDSVYLIMSGAAEVSRKVSVSQQEEVYNVATLTRGDAIGLSSEGFFSQTGLRSGTVIAALPTTVVWISLKDLYSFLQKSHFLASTLKESCENILLINFIKQSHLFGHLDVQQIQRLIQHKRKIHVPAGKTLFKEGDKADKLFFVLAGRILIKTNGAVLATIEPFNILGEGAFIVGENRNADAIAEINSDLFILDAQIINQIDSPSFSHEVETMRISQLRPIPYLNTSVIVEATPENERLMTLYNPINQSKLTISQDDYVIWNHLNGKTTLFSISENSVLKSKNITLEMIYARILAMADAGLLELKKKTFFDKLREKIKLAW